MSQEMEIVPNLRPIVFWLKVRTRGSQPSICVPTFSQFTNWAEGYGVEHSAQMFCGECSTPFPRSDSFVSYIVFFKQKMQDGFPSLVEHLPLLEQDEPPWLVLDRTLSAKIRSLE